VITRPASSVSAGKIAYHLAEEACAGLTEGEFAYVLSAFPLVAESVKAAALEAYRDVERGLAV